MNRRSLVVSLIGRPNVGKSSLFNRFMRKAGQAITHDLPGVTRDRHYGIATLKESYDLEPEDVILVDTGGFYPEPSKEEIAEHDNIKAFFNIMIDHGKLAIRESDLILLVVDVREGLNPFDKMIVEFIRKEKKDFLLVVNKFDSSKQEGDELPFYELGINADQLFVSSAEHGIGLDSLKQAVHKKAYDFFFSESAIGYDLQKGVKPRHDVVGKLAIVGAPNAGKSTLLNSLVGAKRALVSDIAGTTVDPIEAYINLDFGKTADELEGLENAFRNLDLRLAEEFDDMEQSIEGVLTQEQIREKFFSVEDHAKQLDGDDESDVLEMSDEELNVDVDEKSEAEAVPVPAPTQTWRTLKIVDTAGVRKRGNVEGYLETQSVYSALRSITECDIVLYVVDCQKGITHQDRRLMDIALEKGKSIIICLNKVDLIPGIMKDRKAKNDWLLDLRVDIPWLDFCELVPLSALKKNHFNRLRRAIIKTIIIRKTKVSTGQLNRNVATLVDRNPVNLKGAHGQKFRVKYASMIKASPPTFILFCNKSQGIPKNYRRYLQNGIRNEFNLVNTPVHLIFRTGADLEKRLKEQGKTKSTK